MECNTAKGKGSKMRAWQMTELGQVAQMGQVPDPVPQQGQALIDVAACGLNHADLLMQMGTYQERPALPFIPGLEVAGRIAALGPDTAGPVIGARVAAFVSSGGLAQRIVVDLSRITPLPDTVDFVTAAATQIAYGTSHLALTHRAKLQPGETVLVLGAAGGVGLTAVEIAKSMGARVIASARGAERLAIAQQAGADHLIDSETPDLKAAFKALGGLNVVYDAVGGPAFMAALSATSPEGRLLTIGFAGGDVPQIPANLLLVKNLTVLGFYWGAYLKFAPNLLTDSLRTVFEAIAAGELRPHISDVLPFNDYPTGLALLRDRKSTGKVVITIDTET